MVSAGCSATWCASHAASTRSAVRRCPNSSCRSCARRTRSSSCNVSTCWLSWRRCASACANAPPRWRSAAATVSSSPIGMVGRARTAPRSCCSMPPMAATSRPSGAKAWRMFQRMASNRPATHSASSSSCASRLAMASRRSLSCDAASDTVHRLPSARGTCQRTWRTSAGESQSRCSATSQPSGGASAGTGGGPSKTRPSWACTCSTRWRSGCCASSNCKACRAFRALVSSVPASWPRRATMLARAMAASTSSSMSRSARQSPCTKASNSTANATTPARRMSWPGRCSGAIGMDRV